VACSAIANSTVQCRVMLLTSRFHSMLTLWLVLIGTAMAQGPAIRLDSSDWWSYTRLEELPVEEASHSVVWQRREPPETTFQIAGVKLGQPWDFSAIRSRFGGAIEVERGDAASGRSQTCYVSISGDVHLIFEFGELNSALYLFKDGQKWNGSELCSPSTLVSADISTLSGLRLGITQKQVNRILGDPSVVVPEKLVYHFALQKKTTPDRLAKLRKENPGMSDSEFQKSFQYSNVEDYIEARFVSGKLDYLDISRSETY
jgi:hypothetical protein